MAVFDEITPDYTQLLSLKDRHILVLGGGLGIGHQTCVGAAALGAKVTVVDFQPERAESVAAEVGGFAQVGDATKREDMERIIGAAVDHYGPLDGLADIVGISTWGQVTTFTDEEWQRDLDLNLKHVFLALQLGSKAMVDGGSFAIVGSVSGLRSAPNHGAYGAAKAGVTSLVSTAAVELGPRRIRVNAVAPGQTATPRIVERHPEPDYYVRQAQQVPIGRTGEPRDIASALLFFLSDLSSWVTGQTLVVDGGASRKFAYSL